MVGDEGPYMNEEGDIWVPRTLPYLEARKIAREAMSTYDDRLVYVGKEMADLLGFARDCQCDEVCEKRWYGDEETGDRMDTGDRVCKVPAWHFRSEEPA